MLGVPQFSGIFLHPTSLPGRFGMGEIGPESHRWLGILHRMGQACWEMLPLGPTSGGESSQGGLSCFAGNPLMISFDALRNDGVLLPQDLALLPAFNELRVDYGPATEVRAAFLRLAAQRLLTQCQCSPLLGHAFESFCDREASWLDDWALFAALHHENEERGWHSWPDDIARREPGALAQALIRLEAEMDEHRALQFLFTRQWQRLRAHAHTLGVGLIAKMPLAPAADSADAWAAPQLFSAEAGDGWAAHEADDFTWWRARVRHALRSVDAVRLTGLPLAGEAGEVPWAGLLAALRAEYGPRLPVITGEPGRSLPVSIAFQEVLPGRTGDLREDATAWRFTWAQLTPEIEARLASKSAADGWIDKNAND